MLIRLIPSAQIINDTCIALERSWSKPTEKNFTCKLKGDNVGYSMVYVDHAPQQVENFKCRTNDLTEMNCRFKQMRSFIPIMYQLKYKVLPDSLDVSIFFFHANG